MQLPVSVVDKRENGTGLVNADTIFAEGGVGEDKGSGERGGSGELGVDRVLGQIKWKADSTFKA